MSASTKTTPDAVAQPWIGAEGDHLDYHLGGADAKNYRRFEFDHVAPFVGRSLLEIGSGLGDFAHQFYDRVDRLVLSDCDPYAVGHLRRKYHGDTRVEVLECALPGPVPVSQPVETAVAMNVLEHIEDDTQALRDMASAVAPGGRVVLWVPAFMSLYGDFDRKGGHVRRYTPKTMHAVAGRAGLTVEVCKPINFIGGIAWWAAVRVGRARYPDPRLVELYDRTVIPLTRALERVVRLPFGQSVLCVARVP